jgi:hypothetical protein
MDVPLIKQLWINDFVINICSIIIHQWQKQLICDYLFFHVGLKIKNCMNIVIHEVIEDF